MKITKNYLLRAIMESMSKTLLHVMANGYTPPPPPPALMPPEFTIPDFFAIDNIFGAVVYGVDELDLWLAGVPFSP